MAISIYASNEASNGFIIGNDSTGDGSAGDPYLTLVKALTDRDPAQVTTIVLNGTGFGWDGEIINIGPLEFESTVDTGYTTIEPRQDGAGAYGIRNQTNVASNTTRTVTFNNQITIDCANCSTAFGYSPGGHTDTATTGFHLGDCVIENLDGTFLIDTQGNWDGTDDTLSYTCDGLTISSSDGTAEALFNLNKLSATSVIDLRNIHFNNITYTGRTTGGSVVTSAAGSDVGNSVVVDGITGSLTVTTTSSTAAISLVDMPDAIIENINSDFSFTSTGQSGGTSLILANILGDSPDCIIRNFDHPVVTSNVGKPFGALLGTDAGTGGENDCNGGKIEDVYIVSGGTFTSGHGLMISNATGPCEIINSGVNGAQHGALVKNTPNCDIRGVIAERILGNAFYRKNSATTDFRQCVHIVESGYESRTMYSSEASASGDSDNIATLIKTGSDYSGGSIMETDALATLTEYHNCNIYSEDGAGELNNGVFDEGSDTGLSLSAWQALGSVTDCTNTSFALTSDNHLTTALTGYSWTGHTAANDPSGATYTTPPIIGIFAAASGVVSRLVTGGVMNTTAITPQRSGSPSPVPSVGGLSSSVIGVCPNEAQGPDALVFSADQVADHVARAIGGLITGGVAGVDFMDVAVADPASNTSSGKAVRYETATSPVASGGAFPNTYLNDTDPEVTVDTGDSAFSVEP